MTDSPPTPVNPVHTPAADRNEPRCPGLFPKVGLVMATSAAALWGIWTTHAILELRSTAPHIVKIELADLVREYVQHEARSGASAEDITAQTARFLKAVNTAVSVRARNGDLVLLGNAVVDGHVPDITAAVRSEIYMHPPRPIDVAPSPREDSHGANH